MKKFLFLTFIVLAMFTGGCVGPRYSGEVYVGPEPGYYPYYPHYPTYYGWENHSPSYPYYPHYGGYHHGGGHTRGGHHR